MKIKDYFYIVIKISTILVLVISEILEAVLAIEAIRRFCDSC